MPHYSFENPDTHCFTQFIVMNCHLWADKDMTNCDLVPAVKENSLLAKCFRYFVDRSSSLISHVYGSLHEIWLQIHKHTPLVTISFGTTQ